MNVCVVGLWHLGSVTAACLASLGHRVVGLDSDENTIAGLRAGRPPLFEPGLAELVETQANAGRLSFTSDPRAALESAEVVWVTYDTPVDDDDVADVDSVLSSVAALFPNIQAGALVLISSQVIAGCTRRLQLQCDTEQPGRDIQFAYSPENLRLGKAIEVFTNPDRVVVGANTERARSVVRTLLQPYADRIQWMSVESAEMTKHALNAFLAMCVSFSNEVAAICEQVGADAKEVERGLKTEKRIGPYAYLAPGGAFAGGTLARDVQYLRALASEHAQPATLLRAIKDSNDHHRSWVQRKLAARFPALDQTHVCILGLAYKEGTDTLRRSPAVELCRWLLGQGATVSAHDPVVRALPSEFASVRLEHALTHAIRGADAVVIGTPGKEYAQLAADEFLAAVRTPVLIDESRSLAPKLDVRGVEYISVGTPAQRKTARDA